MYKIDKNIPIPKPEILYQATKKYPWEDMEVGDSFLMTPEDGEPLSVLKKRAQAITKTGRSRRYGTYVIGIEDKGVRVWKVTVPQNDNA